MQLFGKDFRDTFAKVQYLDVFDWWRKQQCGIAFVKTKNLPKRFCKCFPKRSQEGGRIGNGRLFGGGL